MFAAMMREERATTLVYVDTYCPHGTSATSSSSPYCFNGGTCYTLVNKISLQYCLYALFRCLMH